MVSESQRGTNVLTGLKLPLIRCFRRHGVARSDGILVRHSVSFKRAEVGTTRTLTDKQDKIYTMLTP